MSHIEPAPLIAYFQSHPGSGAELSLLPESQRRAWPELVQASPLGARDATHAARISSIAASLRWRAAQRPIRLIGFGLGGFEALETARLLGPQVARIDLISALAPLECGEFLPRMATRRMLRRARGAPAAFRLALRGRALALRLRPGGGAGALFAGARGAEAELARDAVARATAGAILREALGPGAHVSRLAIGAYVRPWAATLPAITAPVELWHGTEDAIAPPDMAEAIAHRLSGPAMIRLIPGAGHHATLIAALPELLRRPGPRAAWAAAGAAATNLATQAPGP